MPRESGAACRAIEPAYAEWIVPASPIWLVVRLRLTHSGERLLPLISSLRGMTPSLVSRRGEPWAPCLRVQSVLLCRSLPVTLPKDSNRGRGVADEVPLRIMGVRFGEGNTPSDL